MAGLVDTRDFVSEAGTRIPWAKPTIQRFSEQELSKEFSPELFAQTETGPAIDAIFVITCSILCQCDGVA